MTKKEDSGDLRKEGAFLEKITNLFDYEIFARVIKAGSLPAAARELHSSPAMISKRLTRLEERLGVRLLQRTTRRLTPTQVGQSFFERVVAVLAAVEDAENFAAVDSERPRGVLKVSLPTAFGRLHVAPRLKAFLDANTELKMVVDLSDDYADLVAGSFAPRLSTWKNMASRATSRSCNATGSWQRDRKSRGGWKVPKDRSFSSRIRCSKPTRARWYARQW